LQKSSLSSSSINATRSLKPAGYEIRAAQLHQVPSARIAGGHAREGCGDDPESDSDDVASVTVLIWQSVIASQRKLYLIPVTAV
jgi:hypothetical protein